MCSMVWGIRCSRDDAKGKTWHEMVRKKREKKRQETGARGVKVSRHSSPKSLLGNFFLRGPST